MTEQSTRRPEPTTEDIKRQLDEAKARDAATHFRALIHRDSGRIDNGWGRP